MNDTYIPELDGRKSAIFIIKQLVPDVVDALPKRWEKTFGDKAIAFMYEAAVRKTEHEDF